MSTIAFNAPLLPPALRVPPVPAAPGGIGQPETLPTIVTTRRMPRRHTRPFPVLEFVTIAGSLVILGFVVMKLTDRIPPVVVQRTSRPLRLKEPLIDRIEVVKGKGAQGLAVQHRKSDATDGAGARQATTVRKTLQEDCAHHVAQAVQACREGRFDAADYLGRQAMRAAPNDRRGRAIRLLAAYLRQYPDLADEAVSRMNGAVEVNLGHRYGRGAFVGHEGDEIVFMAKGRHVRLTVREFNSLAGARFQVTRQFLDNGRLPANDLILGAVHYVSRLDDAGAFRTEGDGSREAARARWQAAARGDDPAVAAHAQDLIALLDAPAEPTAVASRR